MINKKVDDMVIRDNTLQFDFYGLNLALHSNDAWVVENIRRDFRYFKAAGKPVVNIEVLDERPCYRSLPDIPAANYAMEYVVYRNHNEIYTDYHGRGLRVWNKIEKKYRIYAQDFDLKYEIACQTMISSIGQYLDSVHIHRIHALGLSREGKAILILLPEEGGKTTLALRMIKSGKIRLLSDDSPLITRSGEILPFPSRMVVKPGGEGGIPPQYLHKINVQRVGPRIQVDLDYFDDKIGAVSQPWMVLLGERVLGSESRITPAGILQGTRGFIKNAVIGMGLHQGLEYLLGGSTWDTIGKGALAWSRLNNSLKVLNRSRIYRYQIGHDFERNIRVLTDFIG